MNKLLTHDDFDLILDALNNTKRAYEDYGTYPNNKDQSQGFRQKQLERVDSVSEKVKELRNQTLKAS
jgi:hypothetical protein